LTSPYELQKKVDELVAAWRLCKALGVAEIRVRLDDPSNRLAGLLDDLSALRHRMTTTPAKDDVDHGGPAVLDHSMLHQQREAADWQQPR
jgi:hypothetical protein